MKIHNNQATPKLIGYFYQILIAVEKCFDTTLDRNKSVWIECFGDVYDDKFKTAIEVKHHIKTDYLIDTSVDFWKTLKNWVTEDTSEIEKFVLHTTSDIKKGSMFDGWEQLSSQKRYEKIKAVKENDSIKPHRKKIFKHGNIANVKDVLSRVTILSSRSPVGKKWKELAEHRYLNAYPLSQRENAFKLIYAHIQKIAIDDCYKWEIKIKDFDEFCEKALRPYRAEKIHFPVFTDSDIDKRNRQFKFVNEMENLSFKKKTIERAVSDYLRSNLSYFKLLSDTPTMGDTLEEYDISIEERANSSKEIFAEDIEIDDLNSSTTKTISKELYKSLIVNAEILPISGVDSIQPYYPKGRTHHSIQEENFSWIFRKGDLE